MEEELILMLLLERLAYKNSDFNNYLIENYDIESFNKRYYELLDKFLKPYALNKTEKSEENDKQ